MFLDVFLTNKLWMNNMNIFTLLHLFSNINDLTDKTGLAWVAFHMVKCPIKLNILLQKQHTKT